MQIVILQIYENLFQALPFQSSHFESEYQLTQLTDVQFQFEQSFIKLY